MVVSSFGVIALMMAFTDSDDNDDDAADGADDVFVSTTVYSAILFFLSLFIISLWLDCSVGLLSPCHRDVKLGFFCIFYFLDRSFETKFETKRRKEIILLTNTDIAAHIRLYFYTYTYTYIFIYIYKTNYINICVM